MQTMQVSNRSCNFRRAVGPLVLGAMILSTGCSGRHATRPASSVRATDGAVSVEHADAGATDGGAKRSHDAAVTAQPHVPPDAAPSDASLTDAASAQQPDGSAGSPNPLTIEGLPAAAWLRANCSVTVAPVGAFTLTMNSPSTCSATAPFTTLAQARSRGCTVSAHNSGEDNDVDGDGVSMNAHLQEGAINCLSTADVDCTSAVYRWVAPAGGLTPSLNLNGTCSYSIANFDASVHRDPVSQLVDTCMQQPNWTALGPFAPVQATTGCPSKPPFVAPEQALAMGCSAIAPYTGYAPDDTNHDLIAVSASISEAGIRCSIQRAFSCAGTVWTWAAGTLDNGAAYAQLNPGNYPYGSCFATPNAP